LAQKIVGNALWTKTSADGLYTGEFLNTKRHQKEVLSDVEQLDRQLTTIQGLHHTANTGVSGGKFKVDKAGFADNGLLGKVASFAKVDKMKPTRVEQVMSQFRTNSQELKLYRDYLNKFEKSMEEVNNQANHSVVINLNEFNSQGMALLNQIKGIEGGKPERLSVDELNNLNKILYYANALIHSENDDQKELLATCLNNAAEDISDKASKKWRDLKGLALIFVSIALVVVGIVLIPLTYGASILAAHVGICGLDAASKQHESRQQAGNELKNSASEFTGCFKIRLNEIKSPSSSHSAIEGTTNESCKNNT
jgi:hypothetical protein